MTSEGVRIAVKVGRDFYERAEKQKAWETRERQCAEETSDE